METKNLAISRDFLFLLPVSLIIFIVSLLDWLILANKFTFVI